MSDKSKTGERREAESREILNADGQSARLVPNTTGEFSIDRAREGFEKAGRQTSDEDKGGRPMAEQASRTTGDKGIGKGNLAEERGAPPYADRAYAGEQEPSGGNSPGQTGTAGGTNVSAQGGGAGSNQQAGNTQGTGAEGRSSK